GGGSYGVLTSVTYNTHPEEPVVFITIEAAATPATAQSIIILNKSIVSEFIRLSPSLSDLGWGGYAFISPQSFLFAGLAPNTSWADANATVKPFFDFVANANSGSAILDTFPFDTFYSVYTSLLSTNASGTDGIGSNNELASRLIPRDLVEKDYDRVSETLLSLNNSLLYHLVAGGAVSKVDPDPTGLNPAWRKAAAHVALGVSWPEGTSVSDIRLLEDIAKGYVGVLEGLVGPDGGAYFNEASLYEPNFQETFFGDHYSKLQAIKDQYDPVGLFVVVEGVGSERWDDALECLKA
ncbi:hypothetical protein GYMLUDRAFT_166464, partial [Collybiopsis luxurians FD-317 M1]